MAQFFQSIACDSCFVKCDGVMPMMVVAAWSAIDAIGQVNQFMGHSHFDRLGLHIWLNENEVPVVGQKMLSGRFDGCMSGVVTFASGLTGPLRRCTRPREIAVAAQYHRIEPLARPAHKLLTILGNGHSAQFLHREMQLLPVVIKPALDGLTTAYKRPYLFRRRGYGSSSTRGGHNRFACSCFI